MREKLSLKKNIHSLVKLKTDLILKEEILKLKESMQALPQEEKKYNGCCHYQALSRNLQKLGPDEISLILDSKTNEEIGEIWASMKEGDIAGTNEILGYGTTQRNKSFQDHNGGLRKSL